MANPTFTVEVELTVGVWTAISSYVMSGSIFNGFSQTFAPLGRDNTATFVLRNSDKRFSPESGSVFSANWTRGKRLRVKTTDPADATVRNLYIGWITSIQPAAGIYGARTCTVKCGSFFEAVQAVESFVPIQESKTADQVIGAVVGNGNIYPPALSNRWLLGIPGWGELGSTTYLGATTDWLTAETGKTTFVYIGDKWGEGVSVYSALRDTCNREGGRAFIDRSGYMVFVNRHHFILDVTSDLTLTAASVYRLEYDYGANVMNRTTVKYHPRKVGNAPEVLGRIDRAISIPAGQSVTTAFRYSDLVSSGAKIAGRNAITPVATTDFTANASSDGTGTDYTNSVTPNIVNQTSTKSDVKFTNGAGVDIYIIAGAQIRGTAIRDFGASSVTVDDNTSIAAYGLHPLTYQGEMDNYSDAFGMAEYRTTSLRNPAGQLRSITLKPRRSASLLTSALTRTVLDRITFNETQTGVSGDYFIIGEKHEWAGGDYVVTWTLESADNSTYWILGTATLGETTWLGPY